MDEFIVALEMRSGDEDDFNVRVTAANEEDAMNRGMTWADKATDFRCTGAWVVGKRADLARVFGDDGMAALPDAS